MLVKASNIALGSVMTDSTLKIVVVFLASMGIGFLYSRLRSNRVTVGSLLLGAGNLIVCAILLVILCSR
jgi:hypothetical protein